MINQSGGMNYMPINNNRMGRTMRPQPVRPQPLRPQPVRPLPPMPLKAPIANRNTFQPMPFQPGAAPLPIQPDNMRTDNMMPQAKPPVGSEAGMNFLPFSPPMNTMGNTAMRTAPVRPGIAKYFFNK